MALKNNYSNVNRQLNVNKAGTTALCQTRNLLQSGMLRQRDQSLNRAYGIPSGYAGSTSWSQPLKGGGMSSYKRSVGSGSLTGELALGGGIEATLSGSGSLTNADLALIISLAADLVGSGTISSADMALLQELSATLAGGGQISSADMSLLVDIVATLQGSGTISSADMIGLAHLTADITPFTTLSPENLANAVWRQDISTYNDANSAGKKVNDLSGGGASLTDIENAVWNANLTDHTTSGTYGWFIKKLLTVGKFLGLK